ncbi:hemolysin family protein, partial [Pseudomonas viridiflava]
SAHGHLPRRERAAHAVMRLLGGRRLESGDVDEEIIDMMEGESTEPVFDRRERVMISGVLQLAERPIRTVMTPRAEIDYIDLSDDADKIRLKLMHSSYSRLPLIGEGGIDEPLGFVHKKELLKELLSGNEPDLKLLSRKAINLLDNFTILNALEQMRKESTHIAFVVNEFGDFIGVLSMTDILESIAGQLPDASEVEGPDIVAQGDDFIVSGALNLSLIRERTGFQAKATDDYQTLAGLVMSLLDRLPAMGDSLHWQGWDLKVVGVEERRVTRVLLQRRPEVGAGK